MITGPNPTDISEKVVYTEREQRLLKHMMDYLGANLDDFNDAYYEIAMPSLHEGFTAVTEEEFAILKAKVLG